MNLYYAEQKIYVLDLVDLLDSHQEFSLSCYPFYKSDEPKINQINDKLCKWFNKNLQKYIVGISDQQPKFYFTYRPSLDLIKKL